MQDLISEDVSPSSSLDGKTDINFSDDDTFGDEDEYENIEENVF
jgi:hypothetical protein